jgi:hypothetical protein
LHQCDKLRIAAFFPGNEAMIIETQMEKERSMKWRRAITIGTGKTADSAKSMITPRFRLHGLPSTCVTYSYL